MRHYTFQYINGSSAPSETIDAKDDLEFYRELNKFLGNGNEKRLIKGSITFQEFGRVPDPQLHRVA